MILNFNYVLFYWYIMSLSDKNPRICHNFLFYCSCKYWMAYDRPINYHSWYLHDKTYPLSTFYNRRDWCVGGDPSTLNFQMFVTSSIPSTLTSNDSVSTNGDTGCHNGSLTGSFGIIVQFLLASLAFSCLISKFLYYSR